MVLVGVRSRVGENSAVAGIAGSGREIPATSCGMSAGCEVVLLANGRMCAGSLPRSRQYVLGCVIAQRRVVYSLIGSARIRSGSKMTTLPSASAFSIAGRFARSRAACCSDAARFKRSRCEDVRLAHHHHEPLPVQVRCAWRLCSEQIPPIGIG